MAHPEADPVAVIVARDDVADRVPAAVPEGDAAGVVLVVGEVAVECPILDDHVRGALAGHEREHRRAADRSGEPEVPARAGVELESMTRAGDEGPFEDHLGVVLIGVGPSRDDAVADASGLRVGRGDLAVVPIRVIRQGPAPSGDLGDHRVGPAAGRANPGRQEHRVAKRPGMTGRMPRNSPSFPGIVATQAPLAKPLARQRGPARRGSSRVPGRAVVIERARGPEGTSAGAAV
jgi:hypothetical protein